ncbi:CLE family OsCLE701 protein [Zea mays]|uniref:CLE family OsCLE701 protein n=1 Tax=Zea mays TaxID=4577 RepID=A0A1D6GFC1_MAIZE|nr:CLE family OsCLE701 protein [Zea mays]
MARSAVAVRRAALAIVFGGLLLMSLVMDDVKKAAIGGRRMLARGDGRGQSTLEDFQAADVPFQDSKRRVPNGPDPIHNSSIGYQMQSKGETEMDPVPALALHASSPEALLSTLCLFGIQKQCAHGGDMGMRSSVSSLSSDWI